MERRPTAASKHSAGTAGKPTLIVTTCGAPAPPPPPPPTVTDTPIATVTATATSTPTPTVVTPTPTPGGPGVTLIAAGDIACRPGKAPTGTTCQQMSTSNAALAANPDSVIAIGDTQYDCGTLADYNAAYDPSWGRLKALTHPVPGNHEYNIAGGTDAACASLPAPSGAEGYYTYFGDAATPLQPGCTSNCLGYYSYDLGGWHVVVLNSMLCVPPFSTSPQSPGPQCSAQVAWLQGDLAAHPAQCTLAAWHHPLYNTTEKNVGTAQLWLALYNAGAEIVLNGHAHRYERYAPMGASGNASPFGMREFIVGTGGKEGEAVGGSPSPNFEIAQGGINGVLKLTLRPGGYDWQFITTGGAAFTDTGSGSCHGTPSGATTGGLAMGSSSDATSSGLTMEAPSNATTNLSLAERNTIMVFIAAIGIGGALELGHRRRGTIRSGIASTVRLRWEDRRPLVRRRRTP